MLKRKKGFSLVEVLIAVSLTIVVMTMISQFILNFSNKSNIQMAKSDLAEELRTLNKRIEKELEQSSSILDSYTPPSGVLYTPKTTIYSNENTLIFSRPVFHKTNYMPASQPFNPRDTTKNDVIIIEYTKNKGENNVQVGEILFSLIPATNVDNNYNKSPAITKQKLSKIIVNSSDDNIYSPEKKLVPFTYYNYSSETKLTPTTLQIVSGNTSIIPGNVMSASLVEVNLFARKEIGNIKVRENLSSKIYLRNFLK